MQKESKVERETLRLTEAARYLGISAGGLRKWLRAGCAPRHARLGKLYMFKRADLDNFFNARVAA
jgi:excisionase family DNA binding protein